RQEVHLYYTPDDGWGGDCSCIQEFDCPHVFAAMCALVAEGRTAAVRNLSAGLPPDTHALSGSSPRPGAAGPVNLEQRLIAATGRQLTQLEQRFVKKLRDIYSRSRQTRQLNFWDFQEL